jgi:hypothetical protein
MSQTHALTTSASPPAARRRLALPHFLREPLLHFVVLGGILFAVDHVLTSRAGDPHVIVVNAEVDRQAIRIFHDARGRDPSSDELFALRRVWLDNEVLYREGLALGLDKGDNMIRDRVIFKALTMVDAGVKAPKIEEATLRAYFEGHRAKYDEPARFDFEEAILAGDRSESTVHAFVDSLNAGTPAGDSQAGLRVFTNRPHENIVSSYGAPFAAELEQAPVGEWRVLASSEGLRAVRLKSTSPARPASFENLSGVILQDWTDDVLSEQRSAAVTALAKKYSVRVGNAP